MGINKKNVYLISFTFFHMVVTFFLCYVEKPPFPEWYSPPSTFQKIIIFISDAFTWLPVNLDLWIRGGDQPWVLPGLVIFLLFLINGFIPALLTWYIGSALLKRSRGHNTAS